MSEIKKAEQIFGREIKFVYNEKQKMYCAGNYLGSIAETVFIEEV